MNNNEPNKIVNQLFKEFNKLHTESNGDADKYDWEAQAALKEKLCAITGVVGAVEVMSKGCILKLVKMQCSLRFMQEHKFYRSFADACDCLY